jgi:hypothetical protein
MYPRNAASPERVSVGAVILIADGTVQTSGVSVSVRGQGGASGAGGGTIEYDNGIVEYTPTQAETNFTSFVVVAYKTGCIPVSTTVVTSASATAGYAGLDWGFVANKTTTNALTGTTISTSQVAASVTAAVTLPSIPTNWITAAGINAGALNGKGDWLLSSGYTAPTNLTAAQIATGVWQDATAGDFTAAGSIGKSVLNGVTLGTGLTVNDITTKTGYSLSGTQTFNVTGNITGNLSGSVGSVTGAVGSVTGSVGSVTAGVTVTTNNDKTGYALTSAEENAIADALLARNVAGGSSSGRLVKEALYFLRNKWVVSAGVLTVYGTDDTTSSWTAAVTGTPGADPITANDPA